MGVEIDHAAAGRPEAAPRRTSPSRSGACLGLGQESQGDERVGREQVERHRAVARRGPAPGRGLDRPRRPVLRRGSSALAAGMATAPARAGRPARRPSAAPASGAVRRRSLPRASRPPSQAETARGWRHAPGGAWSASPAPAEAKWGRPPPLPPLSAAIRLTRSPALRPAPYQVVGERDVDARRARRC